MSFRYLACIMDEGLQYRKMYVYLDGQFEPVVREVHPRVS